MEPTPESLAEIEEARSQQNLTRRATAPGLEALLYTPIPCLDHGFVRVVDYMGDDGAIVQAARVSYGRGTRKRRDDRGLIRYLMRHRHTTPLEMCELKLHVKLPIFVARQWIRHRTANVNEYSARYSILDREFYIPRAEDLAVQSSDNKQGRGARLGEAEAAEVLQLLRDDAARCYGNYERMIERYDLARELARIDLTINAYTQWYWKVDLHNLLHFLALRLHPHAQHEIRVYGEAIGTFVRAWVPDAWEAFEDYRLNGAELSSQALDCVRRMLKGEPVDQKSSGMSAREWQELMSLLDR